MFSTLKPTAKIENRRLILSLPNAVTPVVWVMDLKDEGTFILRVEQNEDGFFVVQKISSETQKIEDIAYYTSMREAQKTMTLITAARGQASPFNTGILGIIKKLFIAAILGVALVFVCLVAYINRDIFFGIDITPQQAAIQAPVQSEVVVTDNPDAVGVPMSADDFLNQPGNLLPF